MILSLKRITSACREGGAYAILYLCHKNHWLLVAFAYKFEILTAICLQLLIMFSKYFFWVSAYGGRTVIAETLA